MGNVADQIWFATMAYGECGPSAIAENMWLLARENDRLRAELEAVRELLTKDAES